MRTHVAALLLSLSVVACAATADDGDRGLGGGKADGSRHILLDCNTSLGPDQQVTVFDDGSLTLRELTTSGSQVDRALDEVDWHSGVLRLRDDGFGSESTLTKEDDGGWFLRSTGGGFNEFGFADCWVDESP